jgi:hypothetical protein
MADLVAATQLDVCVARLVLLSGEYKMALTFDRGSRLIEHTDRLAKLLDEAAGSTSRAFDQLRNPRDRALAAPLVAAARGWPALLRDTRAELLGPPNVPVAQAAQALATADDSIARALESYRRFRSKWRISDAPDEAGQVIDFLQARRALEAAETELGRRLDGASGSADGGTPDLPKARQSIDRLGSSAQSAAARIDEERRPSARRWVEAETRALNSLLALMTRDNIPEERARRSLEYQIAKVEALEAVAEYTRLTAKRSAPAH